MDSVDSKIKFLPHHEQKRLCTTRPPYRQGKKLTAVRVYTVNDESVHLLIHGVPSIGLQSEVSMLCERYGRVKSAKLVEQYAQDQEEFTNIYHVQYERIQSARFAKKVLDNRSFFGGVLHICYAPELETVHETKLKLVNRKREVAKRTRCLATDETNKSSLKLTSDIVKDSSKHPCKEESSLESTFAPSLENSSIQSSILGAMILDNNSFSTCYPSTSRNTHCNQPVGPFVEPLVPSNSFINIQSAHLQQDMYYLEPSTSQNSQKNPVIKTSLPRNEHVSNPRKRLHSCSNANTQPLNVPPLSQKTYQSNLSETKVADKILVSKPSKLMKKDSQKQFPSNTANSEPPNQLAVSQFCSKPLIFKKEDKNLVLNTNVVNNDASNLPTRPGAIRFLPRSLAVKKKKS